MRIQLFFISVRKMEEDELMAEAEGKEERAGNDGFVDGSEGELDSLRRIVEEHINSTVQYFAFILLL